METSSLPHPGWARQIPRGLLGMLLLLALGEGVVRWAEPGLNGIEPWDWRRTGQAAAQAPEVKQSAVLCFGDSLVKLGVQPRVLAESLGPGKRAYNLALCAGRAPASYFLFRRAIAAGARPEAVVVDFNDSFLAEPPATTMRLYSELLTPGEVCELAAAIGRRDFASTLLTFEALRVVKNRFEIRRAILDALLGQADGWKKHGTSNRMRDNWRANLGAQVMPKVAAPLSADPAAWGWVQPTGWQADPTNAAYLSAFFELAEIHKIPVLWLLPPVHPGFMARRNQLGDLMPFNNFVVATLAKFPGVTVVDGRQAGYDASVFIDMAHLDRDGSARLSRALGALVSETRARSGPGPRIVALPAPSARQVAAGATPTAR